MFLLYFIYLFLLFDDYAVVFSVLGSLYVCVLLSLFFVDSYLPFALPALCALNSPPGNKSSLFEYAYAYICIYAYQTPKSK